jgi:hypothetical protein
MYVHVNTPYLGMQISVLLSMSHSMSNSPLFRKEKKSSVTMGGFEMAVLVFFHLVTIKAQSDFRSAYFRERSNDSTTRAIGHYTSVSCAMNCLTADCCENFHWNYMSQHCILLTNDLWSTNLAVTGGGHWKTYSMGL